MSRQIRRKNKRIAEELEFLAEFGAPFPDEIKDNPKEIDRVTISNGLFISDFLLHEMESVIRKTKMSKSLSHALLESINTVKTWVDLTSFWLSGLEGDE